MKIDIKTKVCLLYWRLNWGKDNEKMERKDISTRKYEVEVMVVENKIYHVYAKDEADLLKKQDNIIDEGKLVRTDSAENTVGSWRFLGNVSE